MKQKLKSIIMLILCLSASLAFAQVDPDLIPSEYKKDYSVPGYVRDFVQLGDTYSFFHDEYKNFKCFDFEESPETNYEYELVTYEESGVDFVRNLIYGKVTADFSGAVGAKGHLVLDRKFAKSELAVTKLIHVTSNAKVDIKQHSMKFTPLCQEYLASGRADLFELVGSHYVSQLKLKTDLLFSVSIIASNEHYRRLIDGGLTVKKGSFSIEGELKLLNKEERENIRIQLTAHQIGGEPVQLLSAIDSNFLECGLDDLEPCVTTFENIYKYATGAFQKQLDGAGQEGYKKYNLSSFTLSDMFTEYPHYYTQPPAKANDLYKITLKEVDQEVDKNIDMRVKLDELKYNFSYLLDKEQKDFLDMLSDDVTRNLVILNHVANQCYTYPFANDESACWNIWDNRRPDTAIEANYTDGAANTSSTTSALLGTIPDLEGLRVVSIDNLEDRLNSMRTMASLSIDVDVLEYGDSMDLSWTTQYAQFCRLSYGNKVDQEVERAGTLSVKIDKELLKANPTNVVLWCSGPLNAVESVVPIHIYRPSISLKASQKFVEPGEEVEFEWVARSVVDDSCTLNLYVGGEPVAKRGNRKMTTFKAAFVDGIFVAYLYCVDPNSGVNFSGRYEMYDKTHPDYKDISELFPSIQYIII